MSAIDHYWIFVSLTTVGNVMRIALPTVQQWFQEQFLNASAATHSTIQQTLACQVRSPSPQGPAIDSLRCFISNEIERTCRELTAQFGQAGCFKKEELLVRVLDDVDITKPLNLGSDAAYQPLAAKIIQRFDLRQGGQLSTWTNRMVISHPELSRFLQQECGIYLISNWAILNGMTPDRLRRLLNDCASVAETEQWVQLLTAYHAIYRRDRLQHRANRSRCLPPTHAQLQAIAAAIADPERSPTVVLDDLHCLAEQLRQLRSPKVTSLDSLPAVRAVAPEPDDDPTQDFLPHYRQLLEDCLAQSVERVINERLDYHHRKRSPTDQAFLTALYLFHCDQQPMGAIAPQVGLQKQYQVSRLLNLNALRTDIQQTLALHLRDRLPDILPDDKPLTPEITDALNASIADLFDTARAEANTVSRSSSRSSISLLTHHICHYSKIRRSV